MALDKAGLKAGIKADLTSIFGDLTGKTAAVKADEIATVLADRIDTYVKTATVSTTDTVTVDPGTHAGGGTGTGTLS